MGDRRRIAVQHHHAHVASAAADAGLTGPVLGVAYDGTGWGPDGTIWGGEILWVEAGAAKRVATLRPLSLPGGEAAVREVWRTALSAVDDAWGERADAILASLPPLADARALGVLRGMLRRGVNAPAARGLGRWFDAVGALALGRRRAAYEGQVAMALEQAVDRSVAAAYPWTHVRDDGLLVTDLRPVIQGVTTDLARGVAPGTIAARFHNAVVEATVHAVLETMRAREAVPVVLTGGCFQNAVLVEGLLDRLAGRAHVHVHRSVPPGDGGLALGQVVVASERLRAEGRSPCA